MYFKRLEMFGFKSCADRTKINFERGITAIVGPNGCGKSNISDAVKWVLGEQSAKSLRGSCMEDVIFNGTDHRDPLGYSEVSLVLSNEEKILPIEYDEVIITRRLYRSGESEYLLNKNPVRLKDISELLMGSGIGMSAYSMIEQGKIDQILSSDPEERRTIFEEASGITKFKTKKREAIRRLEHTEQNLLRVGDITKEVERQINSIERQAKKAKRHQELFERLKGLDTRLAAFKYKEMKEQRDSFNNENGGIKEKESKLAGDIKLISGETEELKAKIELLNSKISQYRTDYNDTSVSLQKDQDKIALDRERLQELYKHEADHKAEADSLDLRINDIAKAIEDMSKKLTSVLEGTREKEGSLAAKKEELSRLKEETKEKEESVKSDKLKMVDVLALQSKSRNEIAKITSDIQNSLARLRRLGVEKGDVLKEFKGMEKKMGASRLLVNMALSKVETLENERIGLQNNLKKERDTSSLLEKRISDSKNHILSLHSKLAFLKELVKKHEGFTGGAQVLLNALSDGSLKIEGPCEPLAELLEPKSGYEAACEAALVGSLQSLVVDNWKTAFEAFKYLNKSRLGKAAFIKNDHNISGINTVMPDGEAVLKNILQFMRFDERYNSLFSQLLTNTFLTDGIEEGVAALEKLSPEVRGKVKLVTMRGDIITHNAITAGSPVTDLTSSIIGRQTRIKEAEALIADSEKNILKLKQELHVKKELVDNFQAKIKGVEGMIRSEEIELTQKKSEEQNLEKEAKKLKEEVDLLDLELEESSLTNSELVAREEELRSKLSETEESESALQVSILGSENFIREGAKKREELLITITQTQTEISSLKKEEDDFYLRAEEQNGYRESQVKLFDTKRQLLDDSRRRQKELKEEIGALEIDAERLKERSHVIEKELGILEGEAGQIKGLAEEKQARLDKEKELLGGLKEKLHGLQMEEAQFSFQMETLRNKIGEIYKVDLHDIISSLEPIENQESIQKEVAQLSQTIEKIGPVNLVAIDEHKELEERYSFLKCQQEDLVSAKDSLHEAIKKINKTTKQLFMKTFTEIQAESRIILGSSSAGERPRSSFSMKRMSLRAALRSS